MALKVCLSLLRYEQRSLCRDVPSVLTSHAVLYIAPPMWMTAVRFFKDDSHLQRLARSTLLNLTAYRNHEDAQNLETELAVAQRAQAVFDGEIPLPWKNSNAFSDYLDILRKKVRDWPGA